MEKLIGREIRGFKFENEDYPEIGWVSPEMDTLIGEIGKIRFFNPQINAYTIDFGEDAEWDYPMKLVKKHLI